MPDEFSQSHAEDVLRRAALLQARSEDHAGVGLSMDELKRAASAAGIDPRFVEQAALGGGEEVAPSAPFMGVETGVERVRIVPGHVSEHEWGQMVMALRREFGADGEAETLGGVRVWKSGHIRVQLEPDGPGTRVTATGEWGVSDVKVPLYASVFYAAVAALIVGGAAVTGETVIWGGVAVILAIGLLHVGFVYGPVRKRARTRGAQFDRALDALGLLAGSDERAMTPDDGALTSATEAVGDTPAEPRIDASLLDAPAPEAQWPTGAGRERHRE